MNHRAAALRMTRSEYLRRLVERDLYTANLLAEDALDTLAPPRVRRGKIRAKA